MKRIDTELLEVFEREENYMVEQTKEFGDRVYVNFSIRILQKWQKLEAYDLKSEASHRTLLLVSIVEKYLLGLGGNYGMDNYIIANKNGELPTSCQVDWQFQKIKK